MSSHTRPPLTERVDSVPAPLAGNRKARKPRARGSAKRRLPQRSASASLPETLVDGPGELLDWEARIDPPKPLSTRTLRVRLRLEPNPERRLYGDQ
jgi:hypothetical protein